MIRNVVLVASLFLLVGCNNTVSEVQNVDESTQLEKQTKKEKKKKEHKSSIDGITADLKDAKLAKELKKAQKHWYKAQKKEEKDKKKKIAKVFKQEGSLFDTLNVGYGGASAYRFYNQDETGSIWMSTVDLALNPYIRYNGYYQGIKDFEPDDFEALQQHLSKSKYIIYWLPKYWSESWFSVSQIQLAMDSGYVPVFMYWYFGDELINGLPTQTEIDAYHANNAKVSNFLAQLNGQKMLILEPEFNKNAVVATTQSQDTFASIISSAIDNVKVNNPDLLVSLCMTDAGSRGEDNQADYCGYENCALGDQYSWNKPERVYTQLLNKLDFVSFQEMVAQFSRDPHNPGTWSNPIPKAYTESEIGIDLLAQRINNFTAFLHNKYNKPVFLPYMTVATATWNDTNLNGAVDTGEVDLSGWEDKSSETYQNLYDLRAELQSNGLFGYAPMALFDNPAHDSGGYQYFMNNEYHLGITKTNAVDAVHTRLLGDLSEKSNILNFIY